MIEISHSYSIQLHIITLVKSSILIKRFMIVRIFTTSVDFIVCNYDKSFLIGQLL